MSEDSDNFTFFAPVKLSPEERDLSQDTCLSDKLGDYDSVARILTSASPEREELAGINSGSSSSNCIRPVISFRDWQRNVPPVGYESGKHFGSEGVSNHYKSSSKNVCAPNPKKHWKHQFTGGEPNDVNNQVSSRFLSPSQQISDVSNDGGIFSQTLSQAASVCGSSVRGTNSSKGQSNHTRSHSRSSCSKRSSGEQNVDGRDKVISQIQKQESSSFASQQFNSNTNYRNHSNHRQSNTVTSTFSNCSTNPISSLSSSTSAFTSSSDRGYVIGDVIGSINSHESSQIHAQLNNSGHLTSDGNESAFGCASELSNNFDPNLRYQQQDMSSAAATAGLGGAGGCTNRVGKSATSRGGIDISSSIHTGLSSKYSSSSTSSNVPNSRHSNSNFSSRSGETHHNIPGGAFKVYSSSRTPSFNRKKHKLNQQSPSSANAPSSSLERSRTSRSGCGDATGDPERGAAAENELYQTHYHSNGAMSSNDSKRIKLESAAVSTNANNTTGAAIDSSDWEAHKHPKDVIASSDVETTEVGGSSDVINSTNVLSLPFQPIRTGVGSAITNSACNNSVSSPLSGGSQSHKSRSPVKCLLNARDLSSERAASTVDFNSPSKRKTPSYNQFNSRQESHQASSSEPNTTACPLDTQVSATESSSVNLHHNEESTTTSKQTYNNASSFSSSNTTAPLSWKGASHSGRRSPLKGHDKSKHQPGPPMARVRPMTRSKPQTSPTESIPGSHRSIEDVNSSEAMRALQLRNISLTTDPRFLRAEQIFKEIESLKTPDPILFPIGGSRSSGCEPNNNHKPFDFESIFLPNSDPIDLLDKEMPDQVLNLLKHRNVICRPAESDVKEHETAVSHDDVLSEGQSATHPCKSNANRRFNQQVQFGHENEVMASERRLKEEFAEFSICSDSRRGDQHGVTRSRDKVTHRHSSPSPGSQQEPTPVPNSSISTISTSTVNPHSSLGHHSSEDITNKAFQTTIPGSNSLQCSIQDETSSNFSNMRNIDEFRDTQHSASKYHTVHSNDRQQRVPVKQEHRAHNSYHGNKSPTIEDLDRLQFQDESSSSSSDPLSSKGCLEEAERLRRTVKKDCSDDSNIGNDIQDGLSNRMVKKEESTDENNEESNANFNDDPSSSSSSSSSEDEDSGSEDDEDDGDDEEDSKSPQRGNRVKKEPIDTSEAEALKNSDPNLEQTSVSTSNTPIVASGSSSANVSSSSTTRSSWSLASFGVTQLSTSPSPVKNQSKHTTGSTRSRSSNSRANSDRSVSGSRSSTSTTKQSGSKNQNINASQQQGPERQNDELNKLSESSISPPIKVVATRKEHTAAIAAKNKDKIASVHPFSKTSTKKSTPDTAGGHISSLTPLISPNKVNKTNSKGSALVSALLPVVSKRAQNEEDISANSKKQKKLKKHASCASTVDERQANNTSEVSTVPEIYDDVAGRKSWKEKKHKRKDAKESETPQKLNDFSVLKLTEFESHDSGAKIPTLNFVLNVTKLMPSSAPEVVENVTPVKNESEDFTNTRPASTQLDVPSKKRKRSDHDKSANKKLKKPNKQEPEKSSNTKRHISKSQPVEDSNLISPSSTRALKNSEHEVAHSRSNHERGDAASRDVSPVCHGMKSNSSGHQLTKHAVQKRVAQTAIANKEVHSLRAAVTGVDSGINAGIGSQGAGSIEAASIPAVNNGSNAASIGSPFCSVNQDHDTLSNSNFSGSEMASDDLNPILGNANFQSMSTSIPLTTSARISGSGVGVGVNNNQFFLPSTNASNVLASGALSTTSSAASSSSTPVAAASETHSGTRQNDSSGLKTFYSEQARMFKRKADNGCKLESCLDYAQAVIYYISYAVACLNSNDSLRAFKIFTAKEIKSIINVAMKLNVKHQNATINQDRIDIITVLLMKIRGYTEIQAYNVRKEQSVRYVGTLADFIRDRNEHQNSNNGRMDPESPTQSVASYGSNGSGHHLQQNGGVGGSGGGGGASSVSSDSSSSVGVNSVSAINMPADMYSIFENYIDASQHLIAAHDTWDQAVLLLKRPNVAKFYCTVDQECGYTVNIQSQPEPFINYCNAVISLIRPKMVNNNANSPAIHSALSGAGAITLTTAATTASANNQQSNVLVTANHSTPS